MKKLIIVRHGAYDSATGDLTTWGGKAIESLAKEIQLICSESEARLLSSAAPRSIQSASIISNLLNVPVESYPILWSQPNGDHPCKIDEVLEVIDRVSDKDVLIIITHLE